MHYRIKEVTRYGMKQAIGMLYNDQGTLLGTVEAWSTVGALCALKTLANRINKGV